MPDLVLRPGWNSQPPDGIDLSQELSGTSGPGFMILPSRLNPKGIVSACNLGYEYTQTHSSTQPRQTPSEYGTVLRLVADHGGSVDDRVRALNTQKTARVVPMTTIVVWKPITYSTGKTGFFVGAGHAGSCNSQSTGEFRFGYDAGNGYNRYAVFTAMMDRWNVAVISTRPVIGSEISASVNGRAPTSYTGSTAYVGDGPLSSDSKVELIDYEFTNYYHPNCEIAWLASLPGIYLSQAQCQQIALCPEDAFTFGFEPDDIYLWGTAGGGTTHNLESAAAAQSTAAGALTLAVPIAGAAVALATANGALSVSIPLAGAAAAQAAASGDLSASGAASLAGSATVSASATGALSLSVPLSGSAVAQALASAGLAHGVPLSGAASGQAAASGSMSINVSLAGSAIAQAAAAAGLTVTNANSLAGAASAQASAAGALTHIVPLTGAALTVSNADGSLTHIVPLSGSAAAASLATGGLDVSVQLDGDALAQAMASAGLTVTGGASLAGDAAAQAAASGTLTLRVNLAGAAVATAIASGALAGTGVLAVTPGYTVRRDARAWRVSRPPRSWRVAA